jgi:putative RNA 2'-phosphotransferase
MNLTSEKLSKTIAFALRHNPHAFGLTMDAFGWVSVTELAEALSNSLQERVTDGQIMQVVALDSKKRYVVSQGLIRASQGHSVPVNLGLVATMPPAVLYHGTVQQVVEPIFSIGLVPMSREYVHLSTSIDVAKSVGARHGVPVIIEVASLDAFKAGIEFFLSENNVWLTRSVPVKFLTLGHS